MKRVDIGNYMHDKVYGSIGYSIDKSILIFTTGSIERSIRWHVYERQKISFYK